MNDFPHSCRLPIRSVVEGALRECLALPESAWGEHFNTGYHNGGWHACALRSSSTSPVAIAPGEADVESFEDLPLIENLPSLQALIATVPSPKKSVRLMRLGAGGVIREHRDNGLGLACGEARLHLPLHTTPDVFFYLDGTRVPLRAGEWWYVDVSRPHRVANRSSESRIHLVVDCLADEWLYEALGNADQGDPFPRDNDPQTQFLAFREHVFRNFQLQQELLNLTDQAVFDEAVVAHGHSFSLEFSTEEVASARNRGKQSWIEQWIL